MYLRVTEKLYLQSNSKIQLDWRNPSVAAERNHAVHDYSTLNCALLNLVQSQTAIRWRSVAFSDFQVWFPVSLAQAVPWEAVKPSLGEWHRSSVQMSFGNAAGIFPEAGVPGGTWGSRPVPWCLGVLLPTTGCIRARASFGRHMV